MEKRISNRIRKTRETNLKVDINLDGTGVANIDTPVGFFNHMMELLSFHSGIDINIEASGDIDVCDHHIVEDIGIILGECFKEAIGDKKGINRFGTFFLPMDETLAMVSLDISNRPFLHFEAEFKRESIGNFSTEMVQEFFRAFAFNGGITLHTRILYGVNDHHKIEGLFKALGRALKEAITIGSNKDIIPSSKGMI